MMSIGVEGHTFVMSTGSRCTEVGWESIVAPVVTKLVTVTCVTGNEEAGVEPIVTDQQLVPVSIAYSNTVPQSISISSMPIVRSGRDRQVGLTLEVDLSSCLVINEDYFCELIKKVHEKIKYEKPLPTKYL